GALRKPRSDQTTNPPTRLISRRGVLKVILFIFMVGILLGIPTSSRADFTFTGTNGSDLSAEVTFSLVGTDLHVYLVNTSTTQVTSQAQVLTGVFFDVSTTQTLTGVSAYLHSGSVVVQAPSTAADGKTALTGGTVNGSGDVGGEVAFKQNQSSGLGSGIK